MHRLAALVASLLLVSFATPCTIFIVARGGMVIAGANEDYSTAEMYAGHWVRFSPAEKEGELGYVSFGYDFSPLVDQAAMNEAGLFYDYNALAAHDGVNKGAETAGILKIKEMLRTCSTVDEAIEFMEKYDIAGLAKAQMVIGDATGASAIIERHTITRRNPDLDFQIGTNFRTSTTPKEEITCWRYKLCNKGLTKDEPASIESVRGLLEESMPKGPGSISWYTTVCDLKAAKVYLFRKGDFTQAVVIDLKAELEKGERSLDMDELMESSAKAYKAAKDR